jgi:hypothetical protein
MCSQNYPCNDTSNAKNIEEKRKEIITDLINIQEFQNPEFFDKHFDYIDNIEKGMKRNIKSFLIDGINFDNRFILDFDINTEGLIPKEKKFLSFDFYLRQNEKNKKQLQDLNDLFKRKISTIANNLVYSFKENDFTINKKK